VKRVAPIFVALVLCLVPRSSAQTVSLEMAPANSAVLWQRLERLPLENADRAADLLSLFKEVGCADVVEENVRGAKLPNVGCTLPGLTTQLVIVGAHYDKTKKGRGALDNWSGAAMLVSLYEGLSDSRRNYTFRFVGFADEEKGLVGSKAHARQYRRRDTPKPHAMVNIDTIGSAESSIWLERANEHLAGHLVRLASAMDLPLEIVEFKGIASTDSESFRTHDIPVISLSSIREDTFAALHSADDQLSLIDPEHYPKSYRLILAYLHQVLPVPGETKK
jgi:hypothetical protein